MSSPKSEFYIALQKKLRENPVCRYHDLLPKNGDYKALLSVGKAEWEGSSSLSQQDAQQNAATVAMLFVEFLEEDNLRQLLGLPHRFHLSELDGVRDNLRQLKQRYKNFLSPRQRDEAFTHIGKLYKAVDKTENDLVSIFNLFD